AWDAETATGRPRLTNEFVAQAVKEYPDAFLGFGSVDPRKGARAVEELDSFKGLGLKGVKFHPSIQDFAPDDERWWPVFARAESLGLPCLFHTGTSGIGAGTPGGQGIKLDHGRPIRRDTLAAALPKPTLVAAHFGWPWHVEMLAGAPHQAHVFRDSSGWAPQDRPPQAPPALEGPVPAQFRR